MFLYCDTTNNFIIAPLSVTQGNTQSYGKPCTPVCAYSLNQGEKLSNSLQFNLPPPPSLP